MASLALFVVIYFESFGAPLPGESALIAASLLAARGDLALGHVFLAAFLGGSWETAPDFSSAVSAAGRLLERFGPLVKLTPERLGRWNRLAQTRGFLMVLAARFVVVLRQLNGSGGGLGGHALAPFRRRQRLGSGACGRGSGRSARIYFADLFRRLSRLGFRARSGGIGRLPFGGGSLQPGDLLADRTERAVDVLLPD